MSPCCSGSARQLTDVLNSSPRESGTLPALSGNQAWTQSTEQAEEDKRVQDRAEGSSSKLTHDGGGDRRETLVDRLECLPSEQFGV